MSSRGSRLERPVFWAVAIAFAWFADPATAVERIHSDCTPKYIAEGNQCTTAPYDYSLGPMATTEFRGYCEADPPDKYYFFPHFAIVSKDSGMTCTVSLNTGDYATMSCTNWSLTRHKSVSLRLECALRLESGETPPA